MRSDADPLEAPVGVVSPQVGLANGLSQPPHLEPRRGQSIWHNRNFLLLWLAQAISQTAQNAIWYGIVVLVQQLSNSSTQLSLAVLTLIIPSVIFGVLAGVYVDRWDKRKVLIATNVIRGGIAFSYAAFGLAALPVGSLFVINFLFSTVGQFFAPAEPATVPTVVG